MSNPFQDQLDKRLEEENKIRIEWEQLEKRQEDNAREKEFLLKEIDEKIERLHGEYINRILNYLQISIFPTYELHRKRFEWSLGNHIIEWQGDIKESGWDEVLNVELIYTDTKATLEFRKRGLKVVTCTASEDNLIKILRDMFQ